MQIGRNTKREKSVQRKLLSILLPLCLLVSCSTMQIDGLTGISLGIDSSRIQDSEAYSLSLAFAADLQDRTSLDIVSDDRVTHEMEFTVEIAAGNKAIPCLVSINCNDGSTMISINPTGSKDMILEKDSMRFYQNAVSFLSSFEENLQLYQSYSEIKDILPGIFAIN